MRRFSIAVVVAACLSVALWAQQPVYNVTGPGGSAVPVMTTSELTAGTSTPTWASAVVGLAPMLHAVTAMPSPVTAERPVTATGSTAGAQAVFLSGINFGGCTPGKLVSAASTNATSIVGTAAQVYRFKASNTNAAVRYLKLYNKATAPTVGTDTPVQTIALPPSGAAPPELGPDVGMSFSLGIGFALTTGAADSDTGAVAANEILVNYCYKS